MITDIHRYQWDAPRDYTAPCRVYSYGLNELMAPGIANFSSQGDWMLIFFNDPVDVNLGKGLEKIPENSLVIWSPRDRHHYGNAEKAWLHSWIHVAGSEVEGILKASGFAPLRPTQIDRPLIVEQYLEQIFSEMASHIEPDVRILRNLFENWILEMARIQSARRGESLSEPLKRLKRHIDQHAAEKMTLATMAQVANLSPSHLSAEFKRFFGVSPVNYHIKRRMDDAKYLLASRCMSVSEVASKLGYPDIYQFSRMFKRIVGVSPKNFRSLERLPIARKNAQMKPGNVHQ